MNIAFFGLSLLSAYRNPAATYLRGMIRALHARGHSITFYEPECEERKKARDLQPPSWANVVTYAANHEGAALEQVELAYTADLVIKTSGIEGLDALLEEALLDSRHAGNLVAFWDLDVPNTLATIHSDSESRAYRLIPRYDFVLTRGGGKEAMRAYQSLGAQDCLAICNALDPATHHPTPATDERYQCDLAFMGSYNAERQPKLTEFFMGAARCAPDLQFLLAGHDWEKTQLAPNIRAHGYIPTSQHNAFNSSANAVLNLQSPSRYSHAPSARLFEAAGSAACLISDDWKGLEDYFEPDYEILIAQDGEAVVEHLEYLRAMGYRRLREIGNSALRRSLAHHTYAHRASELDAFLGNASRMVAISRDGA